jgi:hypothetical protein
MPFTSWLPTRRQESKSNLREGTRSWESQDVDAQVNTLMKTNVERKVWRSHGHRDETDTENSCRDPFGSMKEHLP